MVAVNYSLLWVVASLIWHKFVKVSKKNYCFHILGVESEKWVFVQRPLFLLSFLSRDFK